MMMIRQVTLSDCVSKMSNNFINMHIIAERASDHDDLICQYPEISRDLWHLYMITALAMRSFSAPVFNHNNHN